MRRVRPYLLSCILLASLLTGQATAAELGEAVVKSFIGQPLVADIELVSLGPDEAQSLQAKIARSDVFRGANISMSPILNSLRVTVARRDGRAFLHLTSLLPVDADYLNIFLELDSGGSSEVRSALLWLAPDPRPAAPMLAPAQAPGPAMPALLHADTPAPAAPAGHGTGAMARAPAAVSHGAMPPTPGPAAPALLHAVASKAALAAGHGTPEAAAGHGAPAPAAGHGIPAPAAGHGQAEAHGAAPAMHEEAGGPGPRRPTISAAVRNDPLFAEAMALAKECEALDAHNVALNGQIVQLEGRLAHLQSVLAPKAAPKPKMAAASTMATAATLAAASSTKADTKKPDYTRWYLIGGGAAALLALIAAGVVLWRRKRGKGKTKADKVEPSAEGEAAPTEGEAPAAEAPTEKPKKPSLLARLRLMWMLRKKSKEAS